MRPGLEDALNEDPRQVHSVRGDLPGGDKLINLGDRDPRGHGHRQLKVPGRPVEFKVAIGVATSGANERVVRR